MKLAQSLRGYGLYPRGVARVTDEELNLYGFPVARRAIVLVGNIGSSFWEAFSHSPEFVDGEADPLDRWSRRVAAAIAAAHAMTPIYPFDGPPYYPFQQWARRAEGLEQSPIGVMIHPEYGLWHSYRFALLTDKLDCEPGSPKGVSPCLECADQPCLHTCPVDAFGARGYDVESCANYLGSTPRTECDARGCAARRACPVAPELRYLPAQGQFHLRAFLAAR